MKMAQNMIHSDKKTNKQPNYLISAQKIGPETLTPKNINVIPIFFHFWELFSMKKVVFDAASENCHLHWADMNKNLYHE